MSLTELAAFFGAVVGTAGLVLGILNYLRDHPKVIVRLKWDMSITDNQKSDPQKKWALVEVTNVGRRPVYVSHASLKLPKGYRYDNLVIKEAIRGERLAEGAPPVTYIVTQDGLEEYRKDWRKMRAVVFDTTGKAYVSRKIDKSKRPFWAN